MPLLHDGIDQAEQLGATAISALAPSYFKPRSLAALIDCAAEIAAAAPKTPFYFYDIPSLTGVNFFMPDFLAQACDRIPTLAGTVMLSAVPVILGLQLILAFLGYDIASVPRRPAGRRRGSGACRP